jgi:hypothetical protein
MFLAVLIQGANRDSRYGSGLDEHLRIGNSVLFYFLRAVVVISGVVYDLHRRYDLAGKPQTFGTYSLISQCSILHTFNENPRGDFRA